MEINSAGNVRYVSGDQLTLQALVPLINTVSYPGSEKVTVYIFTEKNIANFMSSFSSLYCGDPSIILIDRRFSVFFKNLLLPMKSEIILLNEPVEKIVNDINNALNSRKVQYQRIFSDKIFNLMSMSYHLKEQEVEVLSLILHGNKQSMIAEKLKICSRKVSRHKSSAMGKMGMNRLVEVHAFFKVYSTIIQQHAYYLLD